MELIVLYNIEAKPLSLSTSVVAWLAEAQEASLGDVHGPRPHGACRVMWG